MTAPLPAPLPPSMTAPPAVGEVARRGAARPGLTSTTFLSPSLALQFATTRPVTSTVAITRAIPIAVSFHGFFQLSFVMLSVLRLLRYQLRTMRDQWTLVQ